MKRVCIIISLIVGLLYKPSSQTMKKENDSSSTDSVRKTSVLNQIERQFTKIEIRYFDFFKGKKFMGTIWKDSMCLKKEWSEKNIKGRFTKEDTIKDSVLINNIVNYIFYFFVEKNKYIILNPRPPGVLIDTEKVTFDIIIHRKGYNPIKKDIYVEPDFTYSEEFMEFLELLGSF